MTPTGPAPTCRHLLKLLTGVVAGGAALFLWSAAAGASTTEQPAPPPAAGLLTGLVGSGGALTPVIDLVDATTQTDLVSTTAAGLAGTVDPVAAPVAPPLAPVTDPVAATIGSIITATVGALPPPGSPAAPGLPGSEPGQPALPELPVLGPDGRPLPDVGSGRSSSEALTVPTTDPGTASTAGAPLLAGQPSVESLHDQLLTARGPGADGVAARTRDDHPLPSRADRSPTSPAPSTSSPAAPVAGADACSGPSSGSTPSSPTSGTLAAGSADRSLQAEGATSSPTAPEVRAPSDDPGFAPD